MKKCNNNKMVIVLATFMAIIFVVSSTSAVDWIIVHGYPIDPPGPDDITYYVKGHAIDSNTHAGIVEVQVQVRSLNGLLLASTTTAASGKFEVYFTAERYYSVRIFLDKYCYEEPLSSVPYDVEHNIPTLYYDAIVRAYDIFMSPETNSDEGIDYSFYLRSDEKRTLDNIVLFEARQICLGLQTETACRRAIFLHLRDNYYYSGNSDSATDSHLIWNRDQIGHLNFSEDDDGLSCVDFSILTSALLRAVGIPSRVITWEYVIVTDPPLYTDEYHYFAEVCTGDNNWIITDSSSVEKPDRYNPQGLYSLEEFHNFVNDLSSTSTFTKSSFVSHDWPQIDDTNDQMLYRYSSLVPIEPPSNPVNSIHLTNGDYVTLTLGNNHYVNYYVVSNSYGQGFHIDTIGSSDYGYSFMAYYTNTICANSHGEFEVYGWFRQYDTLSVSSQPGRRYLKAYILNEDETQILHQITILDYTDGTDWTEKAFLVAGLDPNCSYRLAFGRGDSWSYDWQLTAEWAGITIDASG